MSNKKFIQVQRPHVVEEYNKFMGGVDLADMLLELYRIDIKSTKWYMRIIYWIIGVSIVNAWLLYRRHMTQRHEKPKMRLLEFQTSIATALCEAQNTPIRKRGRPSTEIETIAPTTTPKRMYSTPTPIPDVKLDRMDHLPDMCETNERCRNCKQTTFMKCVKCKVHLVLQKKKKFSKFFIQNKINLFI